MKYVIKEWLKMPKALLINILGILTTVAAVWVDIILLRDVATLFSLGSDWQTMLPAIVVELIGTIVLNVLQRLCRISVHMAYTDMMRNFSNKIIDAEFDMFVKNSCSKVISASEQLFQIAGIGDAFRQIVSMVVKIIMLLIAISQIAPATIVPICIIYGIGAIVSWYIYKWYSAIDKEADDIKRKRNQELDECVNGFKEVRGFGMQEFHRSRIHDWNYGAYKLFVKRNCIGRIVTLIVNSMYAGGCIIGILYCMNQILDGTMSPATGMLVVAYIGDIIDPIFAILDYADDMSTRLARLPVYREIMEYKSPVYRIDKESELQTESFDRAIELIGVSFQYEDTSNVLQNVHLRIEKGQKVGICGPSGGGKSTLLNLLMDYYVPSDGHILYDGVDYRRLNQRSLRSHIGIINQDIHIFNDTIRENIMYGRPFAMDHELIEASKKANIYEFIMSLPDGFDTVVGPKGLKLSGGQRQRIGLARIFLANPEIILLDEATAALDNESEAAIQDALAAFKDKTIVTIAHRLSTIENSDIIYVIDNHTVVEKGTHSELLRNNDVYARLCRGNKNVDQQKD